MINSNPIVWCQEHGWTEPRQLEDGLWVAFPPGGFIETPLPDGQNYRQLPYKNNQVQAIVDVILLSVITLITAIIALLMFPLFILPLVKYYYALKN
ncbi:MAG: hypothetical protein ACFCU5_11815 [Pleurocapsa sp.]